MQTKLKFCEAKFLLNTNLQHKLINLTKGRKFITNLIKDLDTNTYFSNELLEELLSYHPSNNYSNLKPNSLMIKYWNKNSRSLYVKTENELCNASYIKCIRNLYNKFDKKKEDASDITEAFRNSIYKSPLHKEWRTKRELGNCEECGSYDFLAIDHYKISFKEIYDGFQLKFSPQKLGKKIKNCSGIGYIIKNIELEKNWISYHDSRVEYRILCRSCNSRNGTYGY